MKRMRLARWIGWVGCVALGGVLMGAIAFPGKHRGVVIFDRWDGCILYGGWKLDYIAEKAKETLRPQAGKAVVIDVTELQQPMNPGDALFSKFTYVGPAPAAVSELGKQTVESIRLHARLGSKDGEPPLLQVEVRNAGTSVFKADRLDISPTLLAKKSGRDVGFVPADGPSLAAITRCIAPLGQADRSDRVAAKGYLWSSDGTMNGVPCKIGVRDDARLRAPLVIEAGKTLTITLEIEAPAGEYDFLCGLDVAGGAEGYMASNLVAFDVDDKGRAKGVTVAGRE